MFDDSLFYISLKGVIVRRGQILLLQKHSGRWDLPGGRLDPDELPKQCLLREIAEETGLAVKPGRLLHRWVRHRRNGPNVFLVSHRCSLRDPSSQPRLSAEHVASRWVDVDGLTPYQLSAGIEKSIRRACKS